MKKVLLIAYYFPPIAATGAMRPLHFCRYLRSYGWAVQVLATDLGSVLPPHAADRHLLDRISPDIEVTRIQHPNPIGRLLRVRERFSRLLARRKLSSSISLAGGRGGTPELAIGPASVARAGLRFLLEAVWGFPDPQCHWYRPAVRALETMPLEKRPHIIVATGGPWTSLMVGWRLAKIFGVPFIADFRDPWSSNPCPPSSFPYLIRRSQKLEQTLCRDAVRIIANTEELRNDFIARYPEIRERCITITNGYDNVSNEVYTGTSEEDRGISTAAVDMPNGRMVEFCHFGTIYDNRNPHALLQAVHDLLADHAEIGRLIRLRFVGTWEVTNRQSEALAQELEQHGILRRDPPLSHTACLQEMKMAQILLVLQPEYRLQIPAKIYEYIASGRPIVLVGGEGATANLVSSHGLGQACVNDRQSIRKMLADIALGRISLSRAQGDRIEEFDYRVLTKRLATVLDDAIKPPVR